MRWVPAFLLAVMLQEQNKLDVAWGRWKQKCTYQARLSLECLLCNTSTVCYHMISLDYCYDWQWHRQLFVQIAAPYTHTNTNTDAHTHIKSWKLQTLPKTAPWIPLDTLIWKIRWERERVCVCDAGRVTGYWLVGLTHTVLPLKHHQLLQERNSELVKPSKMTLFCISK
jgi:hypothetical protein